jgi:hypothetical protein
VIYTCCEENRRALVNAHPTLNGIDWLEVLDLDAPPGSPRQRTLLVRLLKPVPAGLGPDNVRIDGGERIRNIAVEWVGAANSPPATTTPAEQAFFTALPDADEVLLVRTDSEGDFSTYRLGLVLGPGDDAPPVGFDPRLSTVEFAFKVECPSDFDCAPRFDCPETPLAAADLNYLARDYESLRRFVTDRLSRQMPGWRDRSPADLATTLAELVAYVGDLQHYQLDATTTEAYLLTARHRASLRRHALLVDYAMHEGCNARTWLHFSVSGAPFALPSGLRFYTRVPGVPPRITPASPEQRNALSAQPLVFEPMHGGLMVAAHGRTRVGGEALEGMRFYTWGDERCCLPAGATSATLRDDPAERLLLRAGDVLIFKERLGPSTGEPGDADPGRRHAVRLTRVHPEAQPVAGLDGSEIDRTAGAIVLDPLTAGTASEQAIVDVEWSRDDALPFPLCLSSETDEAHGSELIEDVSVALGNNVLVDHGETIGDQQLPDVSAALLQFPPTPGDPCARARPEPIPARYHPTLADGPVTRQGTVIRTRIEAGLRRSERVAFDPAAAASAALTWRTADAVPSITLQSTMAAATDHWTARRDLLDSRDGDPHFVVESAADGSARLRFGEPPHGRRPDAGTGFLATYRVGNGPSGNVGADSIAHVLTTDGRIDAVSNPLPAGGGAAPESAAEVRRRAPQAFRTQERAVTPADYAEVTERLPAVQRAAASLRWTGSWHTVFTTVDREGGERVDEAFAGTVVEHLDRYRMAGHDLRVNDPMLVSLEIDLLVCVDDAYFRSDVRAGLLDVLSDRVRQDGTRGLFHPDNFSFGQTVYLSPLYAAARTVAGVVSVQVLRFTRQGDDDPTPLADGYMRLDRLEIARLDNDPNFPEHGVLRLELHGGK